MACRGHEREQGHGQGAAVATQGTGEGGGQGRLVYRTGGPVPIGRERQDERSADDSRMETVVALVTGGRDHAKQCKNRTWPLRKRRGNGK